MNRKVIEKNGEGGKIKPKTAYADNRMMSLLILKKFIKRW